MPPRGIPCNMCGGMFFASSLKIHQKQCAIKMGAQMTQCGDCHKEISMLELKTHLSKCPAFRKYKQALVDAGVSPTAPPSEAPDDSTYAALIPCLFCGRTFVPDRVQVHMRICKKTGVKKRPAFCAQQKRQPTDGTGFALPPRKDTYASERTTETNWREKSAALRAAALEGRSMASHGSFQHVAASSQRQTPDRRGAAGPSATRAASGRAPRKAATPIQPSRMKSPLPLEASPGPPSSSSDTSTPSKLVSRTQVGTRADASPRRVLGGASAIRRRAAAPFLTPDTKAGATKGAAAVMRASEPASVFAKSRLRAPTPTGSARTTQTSSVSASVSARESAVAVRPTSSGLIRANAKALTGRSRAPASTESQPRTPAPMSPGNKKMQWGAPPPRDGSRPAWGRQMAMGAGGGIGNSNETSPDNPLAFGFR